MSFVENLESRSLLSAASATPIFASPTTTVHPISLFDMVPHEWAGDLSSLPESQPVWTNTISGAHFTEPFLSASGRLQTFGSTKADQISVEHVTGLDTSSPLPAFIITDANEFVEQTYPNGGSSLTINRVMIDSQSDLLPDMHGGLSPAEKVLQEYQASVAGQESNLGYIKEVTIPGIERDIANYKTNVEKYQDVAMTRVRVGNLYDVYVPDSVGVSTVAIDAGAGNDTISVAPNVTAKTSILGGKGSDTIISGKMHTYLSGGAGDDRLVSRSRHGGTLEGGAGADTLEARVSKINLSGASSADSVVVHGQSYPMATAAGTLGVSSTRNLFSDVMVLTPDGLI